jgi:hypothetical protein
LAGQLFLRGSVQGDAIRLAFIMFTAAHWVHTIRPHGSFDTLHVRKFAAL